MAAQQSTPEYKAVKKNINLLVGVVAQGMIPNSLFEKDVIDEEMWGFAANPSVAATPKEKGQKIMKQVVKAVREDQTLFEAFCTALDTDKAGQGASRKVRGMS